MSTESLESEKKNSYPLKGKRLDLLPSSYTMIDLETTGLSPLNNEIIEFGAIKVRDNQIVSHFSELVRPNHFRYLPFSSTSEDYVVLENGKKVVYLDPIIISITHITNRMLQDARPQADVLKNFLRFVGEDTIVGHNVSFDIDFVYHQSDILLGKPFTNPYVDTLWISRRLYKETRRHRLSDLALYYGVDYTKAHRAVEDCEITKLCYDGLRRDVVDIYPSEEMFFSGKGKRVLPKASFKGNRDNPFYGKKVVFTAFKDNNGKELLMKRVLEDGGSVQLYLREDTDYLIVGESDKVTGLYLQRERYPGLNVIRYPEKEA